MRQLVADDEIFYPAIRDLIAGTTGGVSGIIVGQPLDTIKVRLQTQSIHNTTDSPYKGILDCALRSIRRDGFRSLFRGISAPCIANAPINATVFVVHGTTVRYIAEKQSDVVTTSDHFFAGCISGLMQCVFSTPNEGIKIKQQVKRSSATLLEVARKAIKKNGWRVGLFQGWWLTIARDVPAFGVYFGSYEYTRDYIAFYRLLPDYTAAAIAGATAGILSFLFTHPIDVLKSSRQAQHESISGSETQMINILRQRIATDPLGKRVLLKGLSASLLRAAPVSAVVFVMYDRVSIYLESIGI